jgi:hypothetical protein
MKWKILVLLCCLAWIGAVSGAGAAANETGKAAATKAITNEEITYNFLQEGTGGSFVNDSSGNYTLTITGVIPYTVFFSDRPARDAGFVEMDRFLKVFGFDLSNPPNALVMMIGQDKEESDANDSDAIVVELTSPQYDKTNSTLKYTAKILDNYAFQSGWTNDLLSKADKAIPESFGRVAIVIDNMAGRHRLDSTSSCWNKHATKSCGGDIPTGCCWNWAYLQCTACHDLSSECIAQFGNNCPTPQDSCNGWSNPKKG